MEGKAKLKLVIDKNTGTVLYAESRKDFVDVLFGLLPMPHCYFAKKLQSGSSLNLHESIKNLGGEYFVPNRGKDELLAPRFNLFDFIGEEGFVKDTVTYMIADDLTVTPMSTVSALLLLNKFNVKDVNSLEMKTVQVGPEERLKLVKGFMESSTVLTDVFLGKKAMGCEATKDERISR